MARLAQLIYSSVAAPGFGRARLADLMAASRMKNEQRGITGMLLYAEGSFFQVLEGDADQVDGLFEAISRDDRHAGVTKIIHEPIAKRAFGEWTMSYADISASEAVSIIGANDFFGKGDSYSVLEPGRAKKLLAAFRDGRWRGRLSNTGPSLLADCLPVQEQAGSSVLRSGPLPSRAEFSFAFQPIIDVAKSEVFSYEALIRGLNQESADCVLRGVENSSMVEFDARSRRLAVQLAISLGLTTRLNLNVLPRSIEASPALIGALLQEIQLLGVRPEQIVLEILEREIIKDVPHFRDLVNEYRGCGALVAIDDFGSGYAGLNLLADFLPDLLKLDMHLVRGIDERGGRQAIVRGVLRACGDLGVDVIAEGVETQGEYRWLRDEGISLFQGNLFARPSFEELSVSFNIPR